MVELFLQNLKYIYFKNVWNILIFGRIFKIWIFNNSNDNYKFMMRCNCLVFVLSVVRNLESSFYDFSVNSGNW